MRNSFYYIKKEELRETEEEIRKDFMQCRDISYLSQVMPLIEEFTEEGDTVLEPFCGMGTTVIGAGLLGRKSIGIELEPERFSLLTEHIKRYEPQLKCLPEIICGDSLTVDFPENVDAVITNVPYYGVGFKRNLAGRNFYDVADYTEYLGMIESVLKRCSMSLKRKGYIVLFCENIRNLNGDMIPQAYDICKIMQKYFHIKDERIVLYEKDSIEESEIHLTNRAHEYVFIGKKKDEPKEIEPMLNIARVLTQNTKSVLIGSLGLYLGYPEVLDTFPQDVDLYSEGSPGNLKQIIRILQENGYKVYSWQDEITEEFDYKKLPGRYYIRGIKDGLIVDITYEISNLEYDKMQEFEVCAQDVQIYNKEGVIKVLEQSDRKDHREQLALLRCMKFIS